MKLFSQLAIRRRCHFVIFTHRFKRFLDFQNEPKLCYSYSRFCPLDLISSITSMDLISLSLEHHKRFGL